jgi:hypothetical protein
MQGPIGGEGGGAAQREAEWGATPAGVAGPEAEAGSLQEVW